MTIHPPVPTHSEQLTKDQITLLQHLLATALQKGNLNAKSTELALLHGQSAVTEALLAAVQKYVNPAGEQITRRVNVPPGRTPWDAFKATGRGLYVDPVAVGCMPLGETGETEVVFFTLAHHVDDIQLEAEFAARGLVPCGPCTLAAINEADPSFADTHPNATHWRDDSGQWHFATFYRWGADERDVLVNHDDYDWAEGWWFGGLRKRPRMKTKQGSQPAHAST